MLLTSTAIEVTSTTQSSTTSTVTEAGTSTSTTIEPRTTTRECIDKHDSCPLWARFGECEKNAEFMTEACTMSCDLCADVVVVVNATTLGSAVRSTTTPVPTTTQVPTTTSTTTATTTTRACVDTEEECPLWARTGQCELNPEYMMDNCPISCGVCAKPTVNTTTTTNTTSTSTSTTTTKPCVDERGECPIWAETGECEENPGYMLDSCMISCGVCAGPTVNVTEMTTEMVMPTTSSVTTTNRPTISSTSTTSTTAIPTTTSTATTTTTTRPCIDESDECPLWAQTGHCEKNPSYMMNNCLISCGVCAGPTVNTTTTTAGPTTEASTTAAPTTTTVTTTTTTKLCADETEECAYWAANGHCETNPGYMLNNCLISCGVCAGPTVNTTMTTTDVTTASTSTTTKPGTTATSSTTAIPTATTVTTTTTTKPCIDETESCKIWAETGQCEMNPEYMLSNCLISCGVCAGPTVNTTTATAALTSTAKPSTTTTGTTAVPTTTTATTTTRACLDLNNQCPLWAQTGHCEKNPSYMFENCMISCGVCVVESNDTTARPETTTPGENSRWFGYPVCVHNMVPICVEFNIPSTTPYNLYY